MRRTKTWNQVIQQLFEKGFRQDLRIHKSGIVHPTHIQGMQRHSGSPMGQLADYRLVLREGSGLHIREYDTYWTAHLDEVDPQVSVLEHLRQDAPGWHMLATGSIGAAVAKAFGASEDGIQKAFLFGAGFGLLSSRQAKKDDALRLARLKAAYV